MANTAKTNARLRIYFGPAIGPGKAELLAAIAETGSISAAGRRMGMGFRRAWALTDAMNRYFREPVISTTKGGSHGGGATLTAFGNEVLRRYRAMQARAEAAVAGDLTDFQRLIREAPREEPPEDMS